MEVTAGKKRWFLAPSRVVEQVAGHPAQRSVDDILGLPRTKVLPNNPPFDPERSSFLWFYNQEDKASETIGARETFLKFSAKFAI